MPCYHPLKAFRSSDGVKVLSGDATMWNLQLPCGQCVGCRLERSRQWAMRCLHEASLYENNCFITLTYSDEFVPEDGGLHYSHFQLFMKRLRKRFPDKTIRFYMAGEYGENYGRPHFHACLFNHAFTDLTPIRKTSSGSMIFRSAVLEELWPYGYSSVGELTFQSAAYVARYIMKKVTGVGSTGHYETLNVDTGEIFSRRSEFNKMSLKPGIGAGWFDKFKSDVYPHDYVVVNSVPTKPPKYYDKLFQRIDSDTFDVIKLHRELDADKNWKDNIPNRLNAKEIVTKARVNKLKRGFDN